MTIGFERSSYSVMEDMGLIEVCALVRFGSLGSEVEVTLTTQDGSAEGKVFVRLNDGYTVKNGSLL